MIIKLYIRRPDNAASRCTMRVDFKSESKDTPRINNLGIDIVNALEGIVRRCETEGEVRT